MQATPDPLASGAARAPAALIAVSVDMLAQRYSRVLLSRRFLRALAAATLLGGLMMLLVSAVIPVVTLTTGLADTGGAAPRLVLVVAAVVAMGAAALGLAVLYLRTLSAVASGARPAVVALMVIVAGWLAVVAVGDVRVVRQPSHDYPLHFLALGALFIHAAMALALVVGPFELWRADTVSREVLAHPRSGTGALALAGRLLDLPDVRAFSRRGRMRAWLLVGLALLLEGLAFYTILKWASRLVDAAARPRPRGGDELGAVALAALVAAALVVGLLLSFVLLRLMLRGAHRLRLAARRATVESADDLVSEDRRPPVLFLRSFAEEQVPLTGVGVPWPLRAFDPGTEYRTLEEMIVHGLTYIGPVVAVANPSRSDTPIGAARWRVPAEGWQAFVTKEIQKASLIVVGVGDTPGLQWEIDVLHQSPGALARTIFVCPPGITRDGVVLRRLADVLPTHSEDIERLLAAGRPVHVLAVALLPRGPTCFVSEALTETAFYVAIRSCIVDLQPLRGAMDRNATSIGSRPIDDDDPKRG